MFWDNNNNSITNVVDKYLNWKGASETWYFVEYNKEKWEEEKYELEDFILIRKCYSIRWWSDIQKKPIYSNKIDRFDEILTIKSWEILINKWIYSDVKWDLWGGRLHLHLIWLSNWIVIDIAFKWLAFFKVWEVIKNMDTNINKLTFNGAESWQKGVVKFKTPLFIPWKEIGIDENRLALEIVKTIKNNKKNSNIKEIEKEEEEEISIEEVPF